MKTLNIREVRSALSHLDQLLRKEGEVVVTRRGKHLARILPARAQRTISSQGALRSSMPKLKVPSEVLIRQDRESGRNARFTSIPAHWRNGTSARPAPMSSTGSWAASPLHQSAG